MMPLKIELLENKNTREAHNVVLLGIGELGTKLVREYPLPVFGENHWAIETLTLCEDDAFQHQREPKVMTPRDSPKYLEKCRVAVCKAITKADILFVVADVNKDPDYDHTYRFAKLHRSGESEQKLTVLIDCSGNTYPQFDIGEVYDLILFNYKGAPNFRPVEMLLTDLYTQWIALDPADVWSVLKSIINGIKFVERKCDSKKNILEFILSMKAAMAQEKLYHGEERILNGIAYLSVPCTEGIDLVEEACEWLTDVGINGQLIVQFGYNSSPDDKTITVSLMYGRDRITAEEAEKDDTLYFDELFEFLT